ncbi:N6-adenosine-methyltransferase subunit mettl3 [Blyttiomyces sp. JEL0837]|nr:N6-adenosine-methyltransferase subunit mettl3 [Blyttiomyces sp. JEL0837]
MNCQPRYRRVEEIVWVKTNQLQRIIRTIAVKGNPKPYNAGIDGDVIVAEVRETSRKPDELYALIERLSPGTKKLEIFGRQHNTRAGWITLGNQLEESVLYDGEMRERVLRRYPAHAAAIPAINGQLNQHVTLVQPAAGTSWKPGQSMKVQWSLESVVVGKSGNGVVGAQELVDVVVVTNIGTTIPIRTSIPILAEVITITLPTTPDFTSSPTFNLVIKSTTDGSSGGVLAGPHLVQVAASDPSAVGAAGVAGAAAISPNSGAGLVGGATDPASIISTIVDPVPVTVDAVGGTTTSTLVTDPGTLLGPTSGIPLPSPIPVTTTTGDSLVPASGVVTSVQRQSVVSQVSSLTRLIPTITNTGHGPIVPTSGAGIAASKSKSIGAVSNNGNGTHGVATTFVVQGTTIVSYKTVIAPTTSSISSLSDTPTTPTDLNSNAKMVSNNSNSTSVTTTSSQQQQSGGQEPDPNVVKGIIVTAGVVVSLVVILMGGYFWTRIKRVRRRRVSLEMGSGPIDWSPPKSSSGCSVVGPHGGGSSSIGGGNPNVSFGGVSGVSGGGFYGGH